MFSLNKKQLIAIDAVKKKQNVFLTGPPGTGKSFTLKEIIQTLKTNNTKYIVTSSTGCSAVLINGQTIHSYFSLGIGDVSVDNVIKKLKMYPPKFKQILELKTLIIDEISMVDLALFEKISKILQKVKNNNEPFGGIQLIIVGDFCQLSPVNGDYCFLSKVWEECHFTNIILNEYIRQKTDNDFQNILAEIRFGKCSKKSFSRLTLLKKTKYNGIVPTKLFSLATHVDAINKYNYEKNLPKLSNIIQCYPPTIEEDFTNVSNYNENDIMQYNAISNDKKMKTTDYIINLYKGLQVMVTRNVNIEKGLINGTMGTIISLSPSYVQIIDQNKTKFTIYYHKDMNENTKTFVKFMPIKLAYAISIHKSQGATLDAIEVDGGTCIFAPGQLYTALSRAKDLKSIKIIDIDKDSFICNKNVKQFYEEIIENEQ
jgi:ATP-dependent DNA helicase PIF1